MQYGDLEKYIHIISDNKHIIQTKIKNKTKQTLVLLFARLTFGILH